MSNKIDHFLGFERLRDGGSLIASFRSQDSCEYWLMFPVSNFDLKNSEFSGPVLVNRTTGIKVDLTIDGAKQWLINLEPYYNKWFEKQSVSKERELSILNSMLSSINSWLNLSH